ncbi:hypothetical protein [Burkholderia cenocepacia]|uniref:hypothetical protein n=1 Tax=Burkholderia cenocepacia TaxID=95486 RepID=UPI00223788D7|nr:hypothetical protein [Burkholderia cenocepacia]MCW5156334.1 hypothetical protein [Burkholderia cenocepacia]
MITITKAMIEEMYESRSELIEYLDGLKKEEVSYMNRTVLNRDHENEKLPQITIYSLKTNRQAMLQMIANGEKNWKKIFEQASTAHDPYRICSFKSYKLEEEAEKYLETLHKSFCEKAKYYAREWIEDYIEHGQSFSNLES